MQKVNQATVCKSYLSFLKISIASIAIAFVQYPAIAGEFLHLKAGTQRLNDQSETILRNSLRGGGTAETNFYVVQFASSITERDRASLEQAGLLIIRYFPDDALVVTGTSKAAALTSALTGVKAIVQYAPEWKISAKALALKGKTPLLITLLEGANVSKVEREISQLRGAEILRTDSDAFVVDGSALTAAAVSKIEGVEWIEPYPTIQVFDFALLDEPTPPVTTPTVTGFESGTKISNFDFSWDRGFSGEGQTVGMADTGLDRGKTDDVHADFNGRVIPGYAHGWGASGWEDGMGHGTHVAGSILGDGANSQGAIKGGAPKAKIVTGSLWSPILNGLSFDSDFDKILGWPYRDGARVHSNSWGADSHGEYDAFAAKVDTFMWNNPDMLVLFAAGNSGVDMNKDGHIDTGSIGSPGTAKNVLTVGASENNIAAGGIQKKLIELRDGTKKWSVEPIASDTLSNSPNGIAAFSSVGPTRDGRLKPEIVAPGTNIVSTRTRIADTSTLWGVYNEHYLWSGGTSMATPITAAGAAVAREYLIKNKEIQNPSGALVKATLIHTAQDLAPGQYGTGTAQELQPRPDVHQGYGRLDMDKATSMSPTTLLVDNRAGVALNEESVVTFTVGSSGLLHATLAYADAPAAAAAAKALVNDLDLSVIDPTGKVVSLNDSTNNAEMIELKGVAPGAYQVVVKGKNVPQGKEGKVPYALIVSE